MNRRPCRVVVMSEKALGIAGWALPGVHRLLGTGAGAGRLAPVVAACGSIWSRFSLVLRIAFVLTLATARHLGQGPSSPSKE
jgi:hypothetical protein